jgi:hypothetical protein
MRYTFSDLNITGYKNCSVIKMHSNSQAPKLIDRIEQECIRENRQEKQKKA